MKTIFLVLLVTLSGCAHFIARQTYTDPCTGTVRVTHVSAGTFLSSRSDLVKPRTTMTDKSQGIGLAGLDQSSSGTNMVEALRYIAAILGAVAK